MRRFAHGAGLVLLLLVPQLLQAQRPDQSRPDSMRQAHPMAESMRVMDSLNAHLDTLVARMNRARGNAKVTAMAAVINEMVGQRRLMQQRMHEMMEAHHGMMPMKMQKQGGPESRRPVLPRDSARADSLDRRSHQPPS